MATATITIKKGTTAEWTESKRVLDDGELGLETTVKGHRIIRIGNGATEFMQLPVAIDIEEIRETKQEMDDNAKSYYDDIVKKGSELLAEMKALATTVELEDDATEIRYRMGISAGTLYFEEIEKETVTTPETGEDTGGDESTENTGGESGNTDNEEVTE